MADRTVILSDVHLPAKPSWQEKLESLRGLWQGARRVVFNGDTVDYYLFLKRKMRCDVLERIGELCREDNVEPIVLAGNSDIGFVHQRHLFLSQGRVLVFHGDVLFDKISPWRKAATRLQKHRRDVLESMDAEQRNTLEGQLESVSQAIERARLEDSFKHDRQGLSEALRFGVWRWLWRPRRALEVFRAWHDMPILATKFVQRFAPQVQCAVVGHVHRSGYWNIADRDVLNTGSFDGPFKPMLVEVAGDDVTLRQVTTGRAGCSPGRVIKNMTLSSD